MKFSIPINEILMAPHETTHTKQVSSDSQQTLPVQQALDRAMQHHTAGDLPKAETIYQQILQADSNQPIALHLLGVICHQAGKNNRAVDLITKAIDMKPDYAEAHSNLGNVFKELGKLGEAVANYHKAIKINPNFPEVRNNLGNALKELEQFNEAVVQYHKAIDIKPNYVEAHTNLGLVLQKLGRPNNALKHYHKALAVNPDYCEAHINLGAAFQQLQRLDDAIASYQEAIKIKPDFADARYNLGTALKELGRPDEAVVSFRKALSIKPKFPEAHNNLGFTLQTLGRLDEALNHYSKALDLKPDYAEAYNNLGATLQELGELDKSIANFHRALDINPDFAEAHCNLGIALLELGRCDEALASSHKALAINPNYAKAHNNLGNVFKILGKLDEAVTCCRKALTINPDYAEAYSNLGIALVELGKLDEAVANFRKALATKPNFAEAHSNLGIALLELGRLDEAVSSCREALAIKPNYAEAYNNLGNALLSQGELNIAIKNFQHGMDLNPELDFIHSNLICCLNYMSSISQDRIYKENKEWEHRHVVRKINPFIAHANDRSLYRRLKIGYISPDFRTHSVSYFAEPLIASHDRTKVEIFCYANLDNPDETTARIKALSDHWRYIKYKNDNDVAQCIHEDGIDILVDWAGHTRNNRLLVMAHKPAPIQITWHGHLNTTGLKAIDYRFTDTITDPEYESVDQYSEELYRLSVCTYCYGAPVVAQNESIKPKNLSSHLTFGSFNNLCKITPEVVDLWANVLSSIPNSRLLLKNRSFTCDSTRNMYYEKFSTHGIERSRIDMAGYVNSKKSHLDCYGKVDIGLDTFPFNGATTTCEALWMGVPVLTLSGDRHVSRIGATMLNAVGLSEMVALNKNEFVQKAMHLANDPKGLMQLRAILRKRMKDSPLCNSRHFAHQIELAYRDMWQQWCLKKKQSCVDT